MEQANLAVKKPTCQTEPKRGDEDTLEMKLQEGS